MKSREFNALSIILTLLIGLRCSSFVIPVSHSGQRVLSGHLASTAADLDAMTVKDLRQLLKDSNVLERGALSKLKRKQDIIDYLQQKLPTNPQPCDDELASASALAKEPTTPNSRKVRLGAMPTMLAATKDDMYDYLYEQYPPLRDENCTNLADDDIRQKHHPMLQNATYSDMDIITLGTASCSPGITRGVSCTALRLHWQKRYLPSPGGGSGLEQTSFQGGTWLFDVGECTQVSVFVLGYGNVETHVRTLGMHVKKLGCWHQSEYRILFSVRC